MIAATENHNDQLICKNRSPTVTSNETCEWENNTKFQEKTRLTDYCINCIHKCQLWSNNVKCPTGSGTFIASSIKGHTDTIG